MDSYILSADSGMRALFKGNIVIGNLTWGFQRAVPLDPDGVSSLDFLHFLGIIRVAWVGDLALCIAVEETLREVCNEE